ncbi:30917_t:CDS:2 [Gigaspora margarita]|uniref:30917_t:CDS:1 n=1 Tax=Gigaspora margarita TaxID=4874 RepID=A0ABN7UAD0_GIGMA|nr:30917_t:CDS:2 [Gigaspora margarita]
MSGLFVVSGLVKLGFDEIGRDLDGQDTGEVGFWWSLDLLESGLSVLAKSGFWCGRDFCEVKSFDGFGILVDSEFGVGILDFYRFEVFVVSEFKRSRDFDGSGIWLGFWRSRDFGGFGIFVMRFGRFGILDSGFYFVLLGFCYQDFGCWDYEYQDSGIKTATFGVEAGP